MLFRSRVYVHRALPEVSGTGTVQITLGGSNSTGQDPVYGQKGYTNINTDTPWVTTQQNAVRTIAIKIESNDNSDTWNVTAMNYQAQVVEDTF